MLVPLSLSIAAAAVAGLLASASARAPGFLDSSPAGGDPPVAAPPGPEAPSGNLRGDAAAAGATETRLPAGAVPQSALPAPVAAEPSRRRRTPRWDWLRHPLSPTKSTASAQKRRRSPHRFLPLPSVRSQPGVGLMLGATVSYAYRRRDEGPNRVFVQLETRFSLRKVQDHSLFVRLRDLLGREEVFEAGVLAYLDPVFPYFGIANNANLDGLDLQGRYYTTRVGTLGGALTYQHPLYTIPARPGRPAAILRSYTGVGYFVDRFQPYEDSLLAAERPRGNDSRRGTIRLGATWDSRDNEWSPGRGSLYDVIVDNAGPWTGSTDAWGRISANFRNYWTLGVDKLVLAHRISFDALWGDPPLLALGEIGGLVPTDALGGQMAGRGWMRRRYIGRFKAFGSLELRFEPIEFKVRKHTLGIGLKGFVDLGMVAQRAQDLPKHWHVSGGTGLSAIWDRFAVLRLDVGFSRETFGVYFMAEHAF